MEKYNFKKIAEYKGRLIQKFAVPRQAGLVNELEGEIVFSEDYWDKAAFKGLEDISHIWLIYLFSENPDQEKFRPTVRPPRLKGDERMGVWATRSPNRPNRIGLSSVKLKSINWEKNRGPVLKVLGADLVDGTPILDIKPYIPYADIHDDARGGFAQEEPEKEKLKVFWNLDNSSEKSEKAYDDIDCSNGKALELESISASDRQTLEALLSLDPRPAYQNDAERIYGFTFLPYEIKFRVEAKNLYIVSVKYAE